MEHIRKAGAFLVCQNAGPFSNRSAELIRIVAAYVIRHHHAVLVYFLGLMSHCSTHGLQKWIEKNIIFKRKEMADIELPQEVTQWELNQF